MYIGGMKGAAVLIGLLIGAGSVAYGCSLIHTGLGLIVGGALLIAALYPQGGNRESD